MIPAHIYAHAHTQTLLSPSFPSSILSLKPLIIKISSHTRPQSTPGVTKQPKNTNSLLTLWLRLVSLSFAVRSLALSPLLC